MSDWDFRKESNETQEGDVGSVASFKAGMQPCHEADVKASKRNVIATNQGWVRRTIKNNASINQKRIIRILYSIMTSKGVVTML